TAMRMEARRTAQATNVRKITAGASPLAITDCFFSLIDPLKRLTTTPCILQCVVRACSLYALTEFGINNAATAILRECDSGVGLDLRKSQTKTGRVKPTLKK